MIRLTFICILISIAPLSCDSWKDDPLDDIHVITAVNQTHCDVYVLLDSAEFIHLPEYQSTGSFEDVREGSHELLAYTIDADENQVQIGSISLFVSERKDYHWYIRNCSID